MDPLAPSRQGLKGPMLDISKIPSRQETFPGKGLIVLLGEAS